VSETKQSGRLIVSPQSLSRLPTAAIARGVEALDVERFNRTLVSRTASWMTGIAEVAQIIFVRKRLVEVQYLRPTITDEQREEFGRLVEDTVRRIASAQFLPHSGIRFPQNPCTSCPYVGLCLGTTDN
jgi:hypothetical protein